MEVELAILLESYGRQTNQLTKEQTGGLIRKFHFQYINVGKMQ